MLKLSIFSFLSLIEHSARQIDNVLIGLFLPLTLLIFWLYFGNPLKVWRNFKSDEDLPTNGFRYLASFVLLILIVIVGVFRFVNFFFLN